MKALNLAATCVVGGVLLIAGIALAGQEKIDVCHITGTFDFGSGEVPVGHVIGIADPAWPAHEEHGDPAAWALISDADGNEYCTAQVEPPPTYACDAYTENNFSATLSLIDYIPGFVGLVETCDNGDDGFMFYHFVDQYGDLDYSRIPYISVIMTHHQQSSVCYGWPSASYISLCTSASDPLCVDPLLYGCNTAYPPEWNIGPHTNWNPDWDACTQDDYDMLATCADELETYIGGLLP